MKIAVVNYGMGNLASVCRALQVIGHQASIANSPGELAAASRIIVPGVGAFAEGMDRLHAGGWADELRRLALEERRPLLGICLGMQFLSDGGDEGGVRDGLGLIGGRIRHLAEHGSDIRVPHVGWNEISILQSDPVLGAIPQGTDFYFVHSYMFAVADRSHLLATAPYGGEVAAVVRNGNVWGTQFHPEKSSKAGLQLLRNFVEGR